LETKKSSEVKSNIYIEEFNFSTLFSLLLINLNKENSLGNIYLINSSYFSKLIKALKIFEFAELDFNYSNLYENDGTRTGLKVLYSDMHKIVEDKLFKNELNEFEEKNDLTSEVKPFLIKSFSSSPSVFERYETITTWQKIYLMRVIYNIEEGKRSFLLVSSNKWAILFSKYANEVNINLKFPFHLIKLKALRSFATSLKNIFLNYVKRKANRYRSIGVGKKIFVNSNLKKFQVEACWREAGLKLSDTIFINETHIETITDSTLDDLKRHNSDFFSLTKGYKDKRIDYLPRINNKVSLRNIFPVFSAQKSLNDHYKNFLNFKEFWEKLFLKENALIYLSQNMYDCSDIAASSAIRERRGISCISQVPFMQFWSPEHLVSCDLLFSHSHLVKEYMNFDYSTLRHCVVTGFINDYRFDYFKEEAKLIRNKIEYNGPKFIITYFEENFSRDPRWHLGPKEHVNDHLFLLDLIKNNENLALILKPKKKSLLKENLGEKYYQYEELINSDRCYIFEDGLLNSPGAAATAADVVINSSIFGASAGIESILCNTPTVFIDRDNLGNSILYQSKSSEFIYESIEDSWNAIEKEIVKSERSGYARWDDILDLLDPFRDGHSLSRICEYLNNLNNLLKKGVSREDTLVRSAEIYASKWGKENLIEANNL
tara:strand:- start:23976 stop:25952 length:1977 start_codon:yes stop_codon:yes gene_type:complete